MKLTEVAKSKERSVLTVMGKQPDYFNGDFSCAYNNLTSLAGSPQLVDGNFFCNDNNLISLVGAPQSVSRDFVCTDNKLTSLVGCPQSFGGFFCPNNKIKSFHDVHKIIKQINGTFMCDKATDMLGLALIKGIKAVNVVDDKNLTQIFNQYLHDVHLLQDALYDAGYVEQARL